MITRKKPTKPKYNGKSKAQIVREAFVKLGPEASQDDITNYMKNEYGVPDACPPSVFYGTRAQYKNGKLEQFPKGSIKESGSPVLSLVLRTKELAKELGGLDSLEELVKALK